MDQQRIKLILSFNTLYVHNTLFVVGAILGAHFSWRFQVENCD